MRFSATVLLSGATLLAPAAGLSQEAKKDSKAETKTEEQVEEKEDSGFHGEVDVGGRVFVKRPKHEDRAKFEEYGSVKPGPVIDTFNVLIESKNAAAVVELHAKNAGYNNQFYFAEIYAPGSQYLKLTWDQIPHLYSTSARTLFDVTTPNRLTIPQSIKQQLQDATAVFPNDVAAVNSVLNNGLRRVDLGVRRDTGKVSYRWTPSQEWDVRIDYQHEVKTGTKPMSAAVVYFNAIELLEPVNYRTQNFSASASYTENFAPGKNWHVNFSYAGSLFENANHYLEWDNPFLATTPFAIPTYAPATVSRNSLPPDNQAHRFTMNAALDLPGNSRFTSTASYSQMRQNDQFIPATINGLLATSPLPASSLNGAVDTLLLNGQLTTKFDNQLTGTLRYRYYDNNNKTPILTFRDFVQLDTAVISTLRRNLAPQYTKQNASGDLIWKPEKNLTIGVTPAWERYDRDRRDVDVTDEFSGKVFVDGAPAEWVRFRASYLQAARRYRNYDHANFVGIPGSPAAPFYYEGISMRKFDLADRDRGKAEVSIELKPDDKVLITPSFGWRDDRYSDALRYGGALGLKRDTAWNAGTEIIYTPERNKSFSVGYTFESLNRSMINNLDGALAGVFNTPTANSWGSTITDHIHTVFAAANVNVIPKQWDLKFKYAFSLANSTTDTYPLGSNGVTSNPQFPGVRNIYHRAEASSKYVLDADLVKQLGWTADEVSLKVMYVLEANSISDWHWNEMLPYMVSSDPAANRSLFLAAINPNYLAHFFVVSVGFKW